ncbi:MAG: hypothetical protein KME49_12130 [Brasilonema octagenarum HA4186-MV1]|jgi:hypothetical protein|nr:hypothetical protein [Brasilonema octagenarum HA4186-MV1]
MAILETLFLIGLISSAAAGVLAVVYVITLLFPQIKKWFRDRSSLKQSDKDNIAFTLHEKLKSGKHKTVQGIFNTGSQEVVDGQIIESDNLDRTTADYHRNDDLVIYN